MKGRGYVLDYLISIVSGKEKVLLNKLINFLSNFYYFYDLHQDSIYGDVFYYAYQEEAYNSYEKIASFLGLPDVKKVVRILQGINNFVIKLLDNEPKYEKLVKHKNRFLSRAFDGIVEKTKLQ